MIGYHLQLFPTTDHQYTKFTKKTLRVMTFCLQGTYQPNPRQTPAIKFFDLIVLS